MNNKFTAWCASPQKAAEYVLSRLPKNAAATISLGDELCNNTFTFREHWEMERTNVPYTFEAEINWDFKPADDPEWTYALNRHTCFVILAKAWLYTGDSKYAKAFERLCKSWILTAKLCDETKNGSWRSLEAGLRVETWLRAMAIFKGCEHIDAKLFDMMNESLLQHGEYLKETNADFHIISNWGVLQDHGVFILGLYFGKSDWVDLAIRRLTRNLQIQFFRDGTHWEQSPMYHCEVLHCFVDVVSVGKQNGYVFEQDFLNQVQNACKALAYWVKPNGYMPAQGDSDDVDAKDIIAQGAYLFNDGLLKYYANSEIAEENIWDFGDEFINKYNDISAVVPTQPSVALPDSGNYTMRSDNTQDAIWCKFHCGCLGSGHGHADQLHIDIAAFGEDILLDTGRYTYVGSEERERLKSATHHNTVTVDGKEFSPQRDTWGYKELAMPIKGEFTFTNKADFVSGSHLGYLKDGVYTRRRVLYIKPDVFVVIDSFYTNDEHTYDQYFHFANGKVELVNNIAAYNGAKAWAKISCLGDVNTKLIDHEYSSEYNLIKPCKALHTSAKATGLFNFVTVIAVGDKESSQEFTAKLATVASCRGVARVEGNDAVGVVITKAGKEYTVILSQAEVVSEVDMLRANGHFGYGKALVFGDEFPETGLCLEW